MGRSIYFKLTKPVQTTTPITGRGQSRSKRVMNVPQITQITRIRFSMMSIIIAAIQSVDTSSAGGEQNCPLLKTTVLI
jgi:hypothetical protein